METGGDQFVAHGDVATLKNNKVGTDVPKTWFDSLPQSVQKTIRATAKSFKNLQVYKTLTVGDADVVVNQLDDALVVSGTVIVYSKKQGKLVSVDIKDLSVPFDTVTHEERHSQPWSIVDDLGKIQDAAVALVQKTAERDPKEMKDAIDDALVQAAKKQQAEEDNK